MPRALDELEAGVRDPVGEYARVARVDDVVVCAGDDERRGGDPVDAPERVPRRAGGGLGAPAGRVRRIREPVRVDLVRERGRRAWGERVLDEAPERDLRLHADGLDDEALGLQRHRVRAVAAGSGAREHEALDAVGVRERDLLGGHAAEARADDVRPRHACLVEHRGGVGRELRDGVRPGRDLALADAAVVEREDAVAPRESFARRPPARARVAEPLDEQHRRSVALRLPGNPHAVGSP